MVERGPEKAGVGGSIPSLATIICLAIKGTKRFFDQASQVPSALRWSRPPLGGASMPPASGNTWETWEGNDRSSLVSGKQTPS